VVRCVADGVDLCGGLVMKKACVVPVCVQVMCEIGRFAGWWIVDGCAGVRGCVSENGCRGTDLENLIRDTGSVVSYTPRAWVELA